MSSRYDERFFFFSNQSARGNPWKSFNIAHGWTKDWYQRVDIGQTTTYEDSEA